MNFRISRNAVIGKPFRGVAMHSFSRRALALVAMAATLAWASGSFAREDVSLAIKGYDPVGYCTDGKPISGARSFEYEWE